MLNTINYWVTQKLPLIYTVISVSVLERLLDLQYMFAVTSGSPSMITAAYLHVWGRIEQLLLMSGDGEDTAFIRKPSSYALFGAVHLDFLRTNPDQN